MAPRPRALVAAQPQAPRRRSRRSRSTCCIRRSSARGPPSCSAPSSTRSRWRVTSSASSRTSSKAGREAKLRTSWTNPDAAYERALEEFTRAVLDPQRSPEFFESVRTGARSLAATGLTNGLAQTVLKATAPGVPDTYQGTELWDLSLVDPDNRRPVDFARAQRALRALDDALAGGTPRETLARELLAAWPDGRIKLYVLATLLRHRAAAGWAEGAYAALDGIGERAAHVVAFTRGEAIVIVPRLPRTLAGRIRPSAMPCGAAPPSRSACAARDIATCSPRASSPRWNATAAACFRWRMRWRCYRSPCSNLNEPLPSSPPSSFALTSAYSASV